MPDDAESLIQLNGINRTFTLGDSQVHALRNINLNIARGEYIAVMGPSGSGKSTLLNLIGLLDRADTGTYILEGRDVTTLSQDELAKVRSERVGFIFQSFHLVPRLTAAANIELPLTLSGIPASERTKRVTQALKEYGLTDRAHHRPNELSGGQRQRVAIARATILRPAVLLADEPTGNLDAATASEIVPLLRSLARRRGAALLIATHDAALARGADRVLELADGRLLPSAGSKALG